MKGNNFTLTYILFVMAQMLLTNYFHFTPYVMLTILPTMVLCIPTKVNTTLAMVIAFGTGLAIDYLAEGSIGINTMSLVPVAFVRKPLIEALCGNEPFEQKESISVKKYGFWKISMGVIIVQFLFLAIYVSAECQGTRPFWFICARILLSTMAGYLASLLILNPLTYDDRR